MNGYFGFCVFFTEGQMTPSELVYHCKKDLVSPILTLRYPDEVVVPVFKSQRVGLEFLRRNVSKLQRGRHHPGTLGVTAWELQQFAEQGWKVEDYDWPRKVPAGVEIFMDTISLQDLDIFFSRT